MGPSTATTATTTSAKAQQESKQGVKNDGGEDKNVTNIEILNHQEVCENHETTIGDDQVEKEKKEEASEDSSANNSINSHHQVSLVISVNDTRV